MLAIERIESLDGSPSVLLEAGERVTGDKLLIGLGRVPVVDGLGLDEVGVSARATGVEVDETLRTSLPHVYAIGDSIGGWMFTHVATYEAPLAVANMLDDAGLQPDYRVIPRAIFTSPELAGVGLTEEQAKAGGHEVEVRRYDVGKSGKARALGDRRGRVKFVLDHRSGRDLRRAHPRPSRRRPLAGSDGRDERARPNARAATRHDPCPPDALRGGQGRRP